jgi:hypothetical protein
VRRTPLLYANGADIEADRPAHVRAASGLAWVGRQLAVVQDDANFVALIDRGAPHDARAVALARGADGRRQFDDRRGNKHLKNDLEACFGAEAAGGGPLLVALGSGSTSQREHAVMLDRWGDAEPRVVTVHVPELYRELRAAIDFAGSELNVEGAVLIGSVVRLFGRGNGAQRGTLTPQNATCDLDWTVLRAHFDAPHESPAPCPTNITQYLLGQLVGVPLGFTDAAVWGDAVVFTAAAEDSPDVTRDGPVSGSVIGVIDGAGTARWTPLMDATGVQLSDKIEGVASVRDAADQLLVVADPDDPERPSELCEVELEGRWRN